MGTYLPGLNFPIYSGWNMYTPVIPKLYWDEYSAEQRIKQLCMNFDKVEHYLDYIAEMMNTWNAAFSDEVNAEFQEMWDKINERYYDALTNWLKLNGDNLFKDLYQNVYFGLNEEGYFIAYIPENWDELIFDTGMVYGEDTYGRLILRWDVDNSHGNVNQRPENWR